MYYIYVDGKLVAYTNDTGEMRHYCDTYTAEGKQVEVLIKRLKDDKQ